MIRTADGLELAAEVSRPDGASRAVVALVHGAGDHRGRVAGIQRALLAGGFAVVAADLRGHGRSAGERGHLQHWTDYRADMAAIVAAARSAVPERPTFIFGHGLGGLIALDYALHQPAGLAGVVASAPALLPAGVRRPLRDAAMRLLARLAPRRRRALDWAPGALSHDLGVMAAYRADPWVQTQMTVRWSAVTQRQMAATRAAAARFTVPVLLVHGSADPVYALAGSEAFKAQYGHRDATLRTYDGSLHEVHHDLGRLQSERDVLRWLRERAMRRMPAAHLDRTTTPSL